MTSRRPQWTMSSWRHREDVTTSLWRRLNTWRHRVPYGWPDRWSSWGRGWTRRWRCRTAAEPDGQRCRSLRGEPWAVASRPTWRWSVQSGSPHRRCRPRLPQDNNNIHSSLPTRRWARQSTLPELCRPTTGRHSSTACSRPFRHGNSPGCRASTLS